jgi:intracellular sulfur oxidation DsrE/DsrF family protein
MYAEECDDKTIETRHIIVLTKEQYQKYLALFNLWHHIQAVPLLLCMLSFVIIPSIQDISPCEITVPLQALSPQTFIASVVIVPTGVNIVPAVAAHGWITVYNGSILAQELPSGFILESASGREFATDESVMVPVGNPPVFGIAPVPVHAVTSGQAGNIPALGINAVYGTSLYLKNLTAFSGGADSYTVPSVTVGDRQTALEEAQRKLNTHTYGHWLNTPCRESVTEQASTMTVAWLCQFVRYTVPAGLHMLSARRAGNTAVLEVKR